MPLLWASCLFRPAKGATASLEVNPTACPPELQEQLALRGTGCLRPRGAHILYERVDDAGQGAFTPPVVIYIKRLPICGGLEVCVKRTLITHFVGRAAREARLQVQLQHPHLLPALASVRGRHHYYLVLPAAEGDLWAEVEALRQQGSGYSEGELRDVARQILLGLEQLHASHLAHRDIKPANVLRMADGRVVVADFGCADGCTTGFVAAGTTQFQPPECRRNVGAQLAVLPKAYDQRLQDMWSVGATLAALWFARMPDVIRGIGTSRVPAAAAAVAAVAAGAACGGNSSGPGGARRGSSNGSINSNSSSSASTSNAPTAAGTTSPAATTTTTTTSTSTPAADVRTGTAQGQEGEAASAAVAAAPPPAQLPRFLACAGFAACPSTVGARGEPMSDKLQDLLSRLLRLRPSERWTASQALQHEWLRVAEGAEGVVHGQLPCALAAPSAAVAAAAAFDDEVAAPEAVRPAVSPRPLSPAAAAAAAAAATGADAASLPPSPVSRTRATNDGRFMPFVSEHELVLQPASAPPAPCTAAAASTPSAAATATAAAAVDSSRGQENPGASPHRHRQVQNQRQHSGSSAGGSSSSSSSTGKNSSSTPRTAASLQSDLHQRHGGYLMGGGLRSCSPTGPGHSHSPGDSTASPTSPTSQTSRSPGEEAEQLALRQQQQRQQQRQQSSSTSSSSMWLLRPSSHNPKRAQRAILRVFVGAGGESSGSN